MKIRREREMNYSREWMKYKERMTFQKTFGFHGISSDYDGVFHMKNYKHWKDYKYTLVLMALGTNILGLK